MKHLYGIIYHRLEGDGLHEEWVSSVCYAESHYDAEQAAEADRQKNWPAHRVHSVTWLTQTKLEAGEVVMVSAT